MEDLIQQYKESLEKVIEAKKNASRWDLYRLREMERNLRAALREMERYQPKYRNYTTRRTKEEIERDIYREPEGNPYVAYGQKPTQWFDGEHMKGIPSINEIEYTLPGGPGYCLCEEEITLVMMALAQLTEKQREAYVLHYLCGLPERNTARLLGISKTTARERLQGAQKRIDKWIKEIIPPAVMCQQKTYELHGQTTQGHRPTLERFRAWMKGEYKNVLGQTKYGLGSGFDDWLWEIHTNEREEMLDWVENFLKKFSPIPAKTPDQEPYIVEGA